MKATQFLSEWKKPQEVEGWDDVTDTIQRFILNAFAVEDIKKIETGHGSILISIDTKVMVAKQIEKLSAVPSFRKIHFQDGGIVILEFSDV